MGNRKRKNEGKPELIPFVVEQIKLLMNQGVPIYYFEGEGFYDSQRKDRPLMSDFLLKVDVDEVLGDESCMEELMDNVAQTLECRAGVYRVFSEHIGCIAWVVGKKNALDVKKEFIDIGFSMEDCSEYELQREIDLEREKLNSLALYGLSERACVNKEAYIKHLEQDLKFFDKRLKAFLEALCFRTKCFFIILVLLC